MSESETVERLISQNDVLETIRQPYLSLVQEVSTFFDPNITNLVLTHGDNPTPDQGEEIIETIASFAMYCRAVHTAGIYSHTIGTGRRFFNVRDGKKENNEKEPIRRFFGDVSEEILNRLQDSNFDIESIDSIDNAVYGTVILERKNDEESKTTFRDVPIWQCCIAENKDGDVDTLYYTFQYDAKQIYERWPESCSKVIHDNYKDESKAREKIKIIKAVYPRSKWNPNAADAYTNPMARKYAVCYIDSENKTLLEETGVNDFPYIVARVGKRLPGTPYARGLGVMALPTLRQLNQMLKDINDATEASLMPVVFGPEGVDPADVDLRPGAYNPVMDMNAKPPMVWTPQVDLGNSWNLFMELTSQVRNLFFVDMWLAMEQNRSDTATEAEIRQEEKFQSVTPIAIRWMKQYYSPIIKSEFNYMSNEGIIGAEIPAELELSKTYKVEYVTRLNAVLNAFENNMLMQTVQQIAQLYGLLESAPQLKHVIKLGAVAREIAYNNNTNPDFVIDEATAKLAMAKEAQEQAEAQMNAAVAQQVASKIDPQKAAEPGSLMETQADAFRL